MRQEAGVFIFIHMKRYIFTLWFLTAHLSLFSQQIRYVKADASGANSGASWQDAFTNLQSALQTANYGDDIWVAAGTYKPAQGDDRTATFDLPVGVRLAGGFAGTEIMFGERNWENNITILSGDIGSLGVWEDNSYHVVRIYGGDSLTVLDGFNIMHGRAGTFNDPTPQGYGGGVLVWADGLRPVSIPLIQNCTLEMNYATSGGAIACVSQYDEHTPAPDIKNCLFLSNRGEYQGGSFCKRGKCLDGRPFKIENCEFRRNYCVQYGGAMTIALAVGVVQLTGCSFVSDSTQFEGGAIFLESTQNIRYEIDSCLFYSNTTVVGNGGAISHVQDNDSATIIINKTIFSNNRAKFNNGGAFCSGSYGVKHTIIINDTRFENNYTLNGGSGIYVQGSGYSNVQIKINRCFFLKNLYTNSLTGGGAFFYRSNGTQFVRNHNLITNSIFAYNDGAIVSFGDEPGISETDIVNCTFLNNGFVPFIKYWSPDFNTTDYYQKMRMLNSVIWEEETPGPQRLFYNNDPSNFNVHDYVMEHSLINLPTCEYAGVDPCGTGMLYEISPQFASSDPMMPDLSVSSGSPVINKGSNAIVDTFGILYDYLGNPRIRQDTVDLGAYETDTSSGISEPFFEKESFLLQAMPNSLAVGQSISVRLLNLSNEKNFVIRLMGIDGRERYRQILECVASQLPALYTIPTIDLPAGMYWLSVGNSNGRLKTEKIVLVD
ncbi:MAG: hypothetical protein IT262_16395 [Saprospiraceae bacterium]|nr:hypothetical protein [Saprospiraceae bacterium]